MNAVASGAADHVVVHRALHNPRGQLPRQRHAEARGAQQWTAPQGYFGPLAMIALPYNEYLQRYGARREHGAVVVEARKNGARIPWSYWHDRPLTEEEYLAGRRSSTRSAGSTATSPSTAWPRSCSRPPSGRGTCRNRRSTSPATRAAPAHRAACRCTGRSTTSSTSAPRRPAGCGAYRPRARRRRPAAAVRRVLAVRVVLARGARLLPGRGGPPLRGRGGIDSDRPGPCRRSPAAAPSATGACTASRRCSSATSSCRAGPATASATVAVGVACHSSPHFGGAVAYSSAPI